MKLLIAIIIIIKTIITISIGNSNIFPLILVQHLWVGWIIKVY